MKELGNSPRGVSPVGGGDSRRRPHPPRALGDSIRRIGVARTMAVTDATAAGGMGPGNYRLTGQDVIVGGDRAAWAADCSQIVSSTASMSFVRELLQKTIGLTADEPDPVTEVNPSRAIFDTGFF